MKKSKNDIVRFESPLPNVFNETSSEYDSDRVLQDGSFYLLDKKYVFTKGRLVLQLPKMGEKLEWILWVKMPANDFVRMTEEIHSVSPIINGELINPVLGYEDTDSLLVDVNFSVPNKTDLPIIQIINNHKELYNDYVNGMSLEKFKFIQEMVSS